MEQDRAPPTLDEATLAGGAAYRAADAESLFWAHAARQICDRLAAAPLVVKVAAAARASGGDPRGPAVMAWCDLHDAAYAAQASARARAQILLDAGACLLACGPGR